MAVAITDVSAACQRNCRSDRSRASLTIVSLRSGRDRGERRLGTCSWCMGSWRLLAVWSCRKGGLNWCMGFWRHVDGVGLRPAWLARRRQAGELVHGVLAGVQGPGSVAAACGSRRSKQGFNADEGRCTQNTQMGQGLPRWRGPPGCDAAVAAVNDHAGLRPICVLCVHLSVSALNPCLLRRVPHCSARERHRMARQSGRRAPCPRRVGLVPVVVRRVHSWSASATHVS